MVGFLSGESLKDQCTLWVIGGLCAHVLDAALPVVAEEIEAEAVFHRIRFGNKRCTERYPLSSINEALEDRVLDSLPAILTEACNAAQASFSSFCAGADVVTDQNKHPLSLLRTYLQRNAG